MIRLCSQFTGFLIGIASLAVLAAPPGHNRAVLRLSDSDYVSGQLADSDESNTFSWSNPAFATPLKFAVSSINCVNWATPENPPQPDGGYCIELAGGDVLFGSLVSLKQDSIVADVSPQGRLTIDPSIVRRIHRWKGNSGLVYFGPSGLPGWKTSGPANGWIEEAGNLISKQRGAVIYREMDLPNKVRFEFDLSWTNVPDFQLALGIAGDAQSSFRFEVWDNDLILLRETDRETDVVRLKRPLVPAASSLQLQLFLDQEAEQLLVYSSDGELLADFKVKSHNPKKSHGVQLTHLGGNLRLNRLRVSHWNGEPPRVVQPDKSEIHLTDGSSYYGHVKSYDAAQGEFHFDDGSTVHAINEDRVLDLFLSREFAEPTYPVRAVCHNGQQISGELKKVENGVVWLSRPGISEMLASPLSSLQSLVVLKNAVNPPALPNRKARLELDGAILQGCLVENGPDNPGLVWLPRGASDSVRLAGNVTARIVYRDPPPPPAPVQVQTKAALVVGGGFRIVNPGANAVSSSQPKPNRKSEPVLHLRSGDKIPCTSVSIDEEGVTFASSMTDATHVNNDQIKVLELQSVDAVKIAKSKRERLLLLPRMQRDNPPTHLVRSLAGDYLRGRVVGMNKDEIRVELRLEEKAIPRETVARIIWLHADEMDENPSAPVVAATQELPRVQAVPADGNRLTFLAERLEGTRLSGRSEILGPCHVNMETVDQFLIGNAIDLAATSLAFHQWRLRHAIDPLETISGVADDGEGKDSSLVGKPAPSVDLALLSGERFHLADLKGKTVVLDFWASWCGPCLHVMPQVDEVVQEFSDRDVKLVAINLEEGADKINAALERLKLKTTVALDTNGRVSERYGVTSIPQTVIIDRNGKVARVFVGGSARFGEQLRTSLESVLKETTDVTP